MRVGGQVRCLRQGLDQGNRHHELAVTLGYMRHRVQALGEDMPGKGSAGVLVLGLCKAHVPRDAGDAAGGRIIVGSGVSALKGIGLQVHMEGLDEVNMPARQQFEEIGGQPRADIPLGDDHALDMFIRRVETGAQAHFFKQHRIDVVEHQQVAAVGRGLALHAHRRADGGEEFVLIHVRQHGIGILQALHHSPGFF
ncbi:hypothetical protein SDC9_174001 [bioreactor metagenome]|uniref:Uncharacterized protein n=1 Tax=bioreactor metagenome TaxID=1076179 RepID=A0A645GK24_9ZZZZ